MSTNPYESGAALANAGKRPLWKVAAAAAAMVACVIGGFIAGREYESRENFGHEQYLQQLHTEQVSKWAERAADLERRLAETQP